MFVIAIYAPKWIRMPFRSLLFLGMLGWLGRAPFAMLDRAIPVDSAALAPAGVGVLVGIPLAGVTWWAWKKRNGAERSGAHGSRSSRGRGPNSGTQSWESNGRGEPIDPHELFMCSPKSSFETVCRAYKSYSKHYHPDAVKSRGGDERIAHKRMQEGNLAFEEIKRMRGKI